MRAQYTQEFKLEAVRQVSVGQAIAVVAKVLGIPKASLGQIAKGALSGTGGGRRQPLGAMTRMFQSAPVIADGRAAVPSRADIRRAVSIRARHR